MSIQVYEGDGIDHTLPSTLAELVAHMQATPDEMDSIDAIRNMYASTGVPWSHIQSVGYSARPLHTGHPLHRRPESLRGQAQGHPGFDWDRA